MKYEYLCGCESDFFTMPANIIAVVQLDYCVQGLTEFSQITECGKPLIAMRRIIRTPTWTVEDQKAGKLPEVGCRVSFCHKFNTNWRPMQEGLTEYLWSRLNQAVMTYRTAQVICAT